jgi:succinyl-CoA synthetase beta subunit
MDIHEYQAKELLAGFGVPVPRGSVAYSPDQAVYTATELGGWHWAVKAQIHSGARGKAGGVKLCKTYHEVDAAARELLGKRLVTTQTGPEGKPVQRVYVEVAERSSASCIWASCSTARPSACASSPRPKAAWTSRNWPTPRPRRSCRWWSSRRSVCRRSRRGNSRSA